MNSESNISKAVGPRVTDTTGPSGAVVVDENGLLLTGDPEFVETYVNRLTAFAKDAYDVTDVSKKSLVDIAAAAAAVVGITASGGQYVRLSPQTITKMANAELIGGSEPGFFLSTLRDESTKAFSGQMQWQPVALNHAQMLNVQMAMMTVALRTAIAHVEKAVAAVDKKVDAVLKLAKADRTGDIVGLYRTLVRLTAQFDETARLSQADWDSIAAIGPELDQATSKLRSFIKQCLDDFDPGASIGERSDYLSALVKQDLVVESLNLLVVAQDAAYKWHNLKLARVEATEPKYLMATITAMRRALAEDLEADAAILHQARNVLNAYSSVKPLEVLRWVSARSVQENASHLKQGLDGFAKARRTQVIEWQEHEMPDFGDAVQEIGRITTQVASEIGDKVVAAGLTGIGSIGASMKGFADRRANARREEHRANLEREAVTGPAPLADD